jgi:phosphocarrier protein HPr
VYARRVTIANAIGLHLRPATRFMEAASRFRSTIHVSRGDQRVNGKSAIALMLLEALPGTELIIEANGEDEEDAVEALATLVERRFEEAAEQGG